MSGNRVMHEAGDQKNYKDSEVDDKAQRFEEGKPESHQANDSKDQRSIANRLAAEEKRQHEKEDANDTPEVAALKKDPTLPAKMHGNEPSRGAKIDAQIQAEEEEELKRKGKA